MNIINYKIYFNLNVNVYLQDISKWIDILRLISQIRPIQQMLLFLNILYEWKKFGTQI